MKDVVRKGSAMLALSVALGLNACGGNEGGTSQPNQAPVGNHAPIAANSIASTVEDKPLQGRLPMATDADGDAVNYYVVLGRGVNVPRHGTLDVQPNGTFTYTPGPDFHGTDTFTWLVEDRHGARNQYSTTLTITPMSDAPRLRGAPEMPRGIVVTSIGRGRDVGRSMVLQPDGKLVVAGIANNEYNSYFPDIALLRYNADGTLDTSFGGGDGMVTTSVGSHGDYAASLVLQPDGKLVVAGYSEDGGSHQTDIILVRYHGNGSLDTSFGGDGIVTTPAGHDARGFSLVLQPDGKLVVAGYAVLQVHDGPWPVADYSVALLRYQTDGSLDASFGGGDGIVTTSLGGTGGIAESVALQPDGKLVVAGYTYNSWGNPYPDITLLRFHVDGSLDTSFGGGDGFVTTPVGSYSDYATGLVVQPGGEIVVTGYSVDDNTSRTNIVLLRYHADGTLDASFDGDGIAAPPPVGDSGGSGASITVQPDGKLVVTGHVNDGAFRSDIALLRYNASGSLDTSFGGDGIVTTPVGEWAVGNSLVLQPDGKLAVIGNTNTGRPGEEVYYADVALLRYNADGSLDTAFGRNIPDPQEGEVFSVPYLASRIFDPDGDTLTYAATLGSGAALPAWLGFNSAALTFSGTVPGGTTGQSFIIRITATDPGGLSVSDTFSFAVVP